MTVTHDTQADEEARMSTIEQVESPAVQAPVSNPVTTRELLNRAADLLEEFGWCQGGNSPRGNDPFCIGTAMQRALLDFGIDYEGDLDLWSKRLGLVHAAVRDDGFGSFVNWNDAPGRTRVEVVARLRDAAEAA